MAKTFNITKKFNWDIEISRASTAYLLADVCDKDLYDLKRLEPIDYIKYVCKKLQEEV